MILKPASRTAMLLVSLLLPAVALPVAALAESHALEGGSSMMTKGGPKHASGPEQVEHRITQLHAQLHITPAQQSQWEQFAGVMRDNAKAMDQLLEQRAGNFASMNAVDNMQSYANMSQQHAQDTQKLAASFQALYGAMTDDQKKNADAVFRARGEHGPHAKY